MTANTSCQTFFAIVYEAVAEANASFETGMIVNYVHTYDGKTVLLF